MECHLSDRCLSCIVFFKHPQVIIIEVAPRNIRIGGGNACEYMDDIYVYSRALTASEVGDIYNISESATVALLGLGGLALLRRRKR